MISVIIPAHNEEKYLGKCLDALKKQSSKNFEVIVVVNGCADETLRVAKKYPVRIYVLKEAHVSRARNYGAKKAKKSLLVFLDADLVPDKDFIEKIEKKGCFFGTCKGKPDSRSFFSFFYSFYKNNLCKILNFANGVLICSKDVFEKVGGFDPNKTKKEHYKLIKSGKKHGKYELVNTYVIISMRRLRKKGYLKMMGYWIREAIKPHKRKYEVVR